MMSEEKPAPEIRLWTPEGFGEDEWAHAETAEALAGNDRLILPLQAFLSLDPQERTRNRGRLGVLVQPGEQIDTLVEVLDEVALVALVFPAYTDGRSYSKAQLLRGRHGFEGTLRAVGDVLVDQLAHMLRVGFTEFAISNPVLLRRLEKGEVGGLPVYYQPAAKPAAATGSYSWRRVPQS